MKRFILFLAFVFVLATNAFANTECFLAIEDNHIIKQEGNCAKRASPCSTFKIALSLMGYNEGLLIDETHPEWPFKEGYVDYIPVWKQSHTPASWMKNSVVWYSQLITPQLGLKKFKNYVKKFNYGNQDIKGDKGKNNGLTRSWLSSSLKISPQEQVEFLKKLLENKLPVSLKAHELTRTLLFVENFEEGKLYGKTGSGNLLNKDGTSDNNRQTGWFIGWVEKGARKIIFAYYREEAQKYDSSAGKRAREIAKEKMLQLLQELN